MDDEPTVGEDLSRALAMALIRKGLLTKHDIIDAAERADDGSERGSTVAHLLNVAFMEADLLGGPPKSESEQRAEFNREQIRIRTAHIEKQRET